MCVADDGNAYAWGDPYKGQITLPEGVNWTHDMTKLQSKPKKIVMPEGKPVKKVVAAGIHSALLTTDGEVYTFGCGSDGRLGHPEYEGYVFLYKESQPKRVETLTAPVIDLACSYYHNICIAAN